MQGTRRAAIHTPILAPRHSVQATVGGGRRRGAEGRGRGRTAPVRRPLYAGGCGSGEGDLSTCPRYTPRAAKAWRARASVSAECTFHARRISLTPSVVSVFVTTVRFRFPPPTPARPSRVLERVKPPSTSMARYFRARRSSARWRLGGGESARFSVWNAAGPAPCRAPHTRTRVVGCRGYVGMHTTLSAEQMRRASCKMPVREREVCMV